MKIFLSSHNFGKYAEDLRELVGDNRRTLVVANARDYYDEAKRRAKVAEKLEVFRKEGFQAEELDLREYFPKDPAELEQFVHDYNPGLIFCIGGDVFLLATALVISGLDNIIRRRLEEDIMVYGGNSAGAMVTGHDIETYERDDLKIEEVDAYYGMEAITSGLGLIDQYIIPHADQSDKAKITQFYERQFAKTGDDVILLGEDDAYIINGHHHALRQE